MSAYIAPPTPTPPATVNAPLLLEVDDTVFNIEIATVVEDPCSATSSSVLAIIVAVVNTSKPLTNARPATTKSFCMPTPPETVNAPVVEDVELV